MMPDFTQLKQKYQPVIDAIQKQGGQLQNVNMDGNQLYLKATMPSEDSKNRVWDAIKSVDASFADLKHDIELSTNSATPTPAATVQGSKYTVKPGDNLSKISQHFYGDAGKYMTIAKANNLKDADKIKAGDELIIPAA